MKVIKMKCLVSDQGTGTHETALCENCYKDEANQLYARNMACNADDIDPESDFVDCSGNDALDCVICGIDIFGIVGNENDRLYT